MKAQAPSPQLPENYAGSEACRTCHEDLGAAFRLNPHYSIDAGKNKGARTQQWQGRTCEACHGPGKGHAESADPKQIVSFKGGSPDRVSAQCLRCHSGDATHLSRSFGAHGRNQVRCTNCHSVHQPVRGPLLASEPNALCQGCHVSVQAEFSRPYRHKLQEDAIACIDCHNPHGEPPPRQLRRVSGNEIACLKCHGDKRGPFPFEHAPVRLGPCTTCHEPHGSANPRMLTRHEQRFLCLECHTSGQQTIGITPPALHDLRSPRFQNCGICHSRIHGSYVSRDLLR